MKDKDRIEDALIAEIVEKRDKEDDGKRYSFDDIKALAKKRLEEEMDGH